MKKLFVIISLIFCYRSAYAGSTMQPVLIPPAVNISSVSAQTGGQAQVLITTPTSSGAYSSGYFTYLTDVHIEMYPTSTLVGAGGPVYCTSAGIGGTPEWGFSTNASSGTVVITDVQYANPLQATQATNVTITCPATSNVKWNMNVSYYSAP